MQDKEIIKASPQQIAKFFDEEGFKNYVQSYNRMLKILKDNLNEGIDYGKPFEGSEKDVLLYSGAQKLFRFGNLKILDMKKEAIFRSGEFWGYEVTLKIGVSEDNYIYSIGVATLTEPKMWNRDKNNPNVRYPKDEHFLAQMAYKRAFVKGVIIFYGLSGVFVEEEYEEETKPNKDEIKPTKLKTSREICSNMIKSHFLPPDKWTYLIDYILQKGKMSDEEVLKCIDWIRDKEMVTTNTGEKKFLRTKEILLKRAWDWYSLAMGVSDNVPEPSEEMTMDELKNLIDRYRYILGYDEKLKEAQKIVLGN